MSNQFREGEDTIGLTNAGSSVTVDLYSDKFGSLEIPIAEHIIGTADADILRAMMVTTGLSMVAAIGAVV